jgi:hypothetical protein
MWALKLANGHLTSILSPLKGGEEALGTRSASLLRPFRGEKDRMRWEDRGGEDFHPIVVRRRANHHRLTGGRAAE